MPPPGSQLPPSVSALQTPPGQLPGGRPPSRLETLCPVRSPARPLGFHWTPGTGAVPRAPWLVLETLRACWALSSPGCRVVFRGSCWREEGLGDWLSGALRAGVVGVADGGCSLTSLGRGASTSPCGREGGSLSQQCPRTFCSRGPLSPWALGEACPSTSPQSFSRICPFPAQGRVCARRGTGPAARR